MLNLSIRSALPEDWQKIAEIEAICFPPAEAASATAIKERLAVYQEGCLLAEFNGKIVGFINGGASNDAFVKDAFYASMDLHDPSGQHLAVFGLDVLPDFRGKGYGRLLMKAFIQFAVDQNKSAIVLTCKSHLIAFYESFGYDNLGLAQSNHGGAQWYDMQLIL